MKHFCTVADVNFKSRVLALNNSLYKYDANYQLNLLCLDQYIYDIIESPNIKKYLLKDLLESDILLIQCKNNDPSREALNNSNGDIGRAKEIQFIWSLAPYFTNYCLVNNPYIDDILYIDSDIYFFDDWQKIYKNTNNINIGLVEHRIKHNHNNGKYNVGIVYFKNNEAGLGASALWRDFLLYPNNRFSISHGDCGDQKYLELLINFFDGVQSFDNYFGHLAPWNLKYHSYTDNSIYWNNIEQKVMYYHFSNFTPYFDNDTYIPAPRHGITKLDHKLLQKMHDEYYNVLKNIQ